MKADISIRVDINGQYGHFAAATMIDEPLQLAYQPMKTTDDPMLAYALGELVAESKEVKKVVKLREDAAKEISEQLTRFLIESMESQDTVNGYPVNKKPIDTGETGVKMKWKI
ncbi:MAG: hypothetical protein ACYSWP_23950 [Planctomycetota bacterium]|jgi:hypothetical protein